VGGAAEVSEGELFTVEEAAKLLNVSVRFVRRLVAERRIAVVRLGRHVRLAQADLRRSSLPVGRNR
jgi:excisionase family DNA binding protein